MSRTDTRPLAPAIPPSLPASGGLSLETLARLYGKSTSAVRYALYGAGIPPVARNTQKIYLYGKDAVACLDQRWTRPAGSALPTIEEAPAPAPQQAPQTSEPVTLLTVRDVARRLKIDVSGARAALARHGVKPTAQTGKIGLYSEQSMRGLIAARARAAEEAARHRRDNLVLAAQKRAADVAAAAVAARAPADAEASDPVPPNTLEAKMHATLDLVASCLKATTALLERLEAQPGAAGRVETAPAPNGAATATRENSAPEGVA